MLSHLFGTALATSSENPVGITAGDATDVIASADLGVTVSDGLATVIAGEGPAHDYLISVGNAGISDATGVTLTATWPAGLDQGVISPSQGTCSLIGGGPDFTCDLGTIAVGASTTVGVAYTVPADTEAGARVLTVSVDSSVADPIAADNLATDSTMVAEMGEAPDTALNARPQREPAGGRHEPAILVLLAMVASFAVFAGRSRVSGGRQGS